jgi:hypothetical protein
MLKYNKKSKLNFLKEIIYKGRVLQQKQEEREEI